MSLNVRTLFATILLMVSTTFITAQHQPTDERVDLALRRATDIDGNFVRATIFNTGMTGRTGGATGEIAYEWPKNSGREHVALTAIWIGAEFNDIIDDEDGDPLRLVDVTQWRESTQGKSWVLEPLPGYNNPNYLVDPLTGDTKVGIAKSIVPDSWPQDGWADKQEDLTDPGWIGSWNGFFGKNVFNADQELFYKMGDDNYDKKIHLFQPDATDPTRGGLGMIIEARAMAWSQILVDDVVYVIHNVQNDGTGDLDKMSFTIWLADVIGNDTQNDRMNYDLLNDMATMDDDEIGWGSVGVTFLETPGNADDRIDNDGDGEDGPRVTLEMIEGEVRGNYLDDNGNGLIDEDTTHIAFDEQEGVTFADRIDNNGNGEFDSPTITSSMISQAGSDPWNRWPPNPENDDLQDGLIHLIMVDSEDEGSYFKDGIDNDDNGEDSSSVITQAMIDAAAADFYSRYRVPDSDIILYDVGQGDLGKKYADGIDNDSDGIVDEGIDENIDEMVDESRDDGVDNDGDWDPATDDVGLDGVPSTGDVGENDGQPTSGSGTGFPGEPNIDKTDVSESDQLGITNVQRFPAGSLNFNQQTDRAIWFNFMIPGEFWRLQPGQIEEGENDLTVASSLFPMKSGQTERISYAVILGDNPDAVLESRVKAEETYIADYQFARAPAIPKLTAVPGDNQVTLYWDALAEESFDGYLSNLGLPGNDFEGYRLYRTQDPAFEDAWTITDGNGTRTFRKPIAQWDLVDDYEGFDPIGVNGIQFDLGDNTGIVHSYIDTDVKNGFTYYYALTSYDYGAAVFEIPPAESTILLLVGASGEILAGQNVAVVQPSPAAAGYQPPGIIDVFHMEGTASGELQFDIVDESIIKDENVYRVTFTDTLIKATGGTAKDTLTTKAFSLFNVTDLDDIDTLVTNHSAPFRNTEAPLTDGFRMSFVNPASVEVNDERSESSRDNIFPLVFSVFNEGSTRGTELPNDYILEFGEVGFGQSTEFIWSNITFPAIDVNFKIKNLIRDEYISVGFMEQVGPDEGGAWNTFDAFNDGSSSRTDIVAFLEPDENDSLRITWSLKFEIGPPLLDSTKTYPESGDFIEFLLDKPFLSNDVYEFSSSAGSIDTETAAVEMDDIKVVPNPYKAASKYETFNPFSRGRGPRKIQFTHLPQECTIRIYTVNGELVDTIEHNSSITDGIAEWDLRTRDNLDISYGVYVYHVEAPGIGEKIGKFAIIK